MNTGVLGSAPESPLAGAHRLPWAQPHRLREEEEPRQKKRVSSRGSITAKPTQQPRICYHQPVPDPGACPIGRWSVPHTTGGMRSSPSARQCHPQHHREAAARPTRVQRVPGRHGRPHSWCGSHHRHLPKLMSGATETSDQHRAFPTLHLSCPHAQTFLHAQEGPFVTGNAFKAPTLDGSGEWTAASSVWVSRTRDPHTQQRTSPS